MSYDPLDRKMEFGKYKDWSIKEIYTGWDNPSEQFIHHYIFDRLSRAKSYEFPNIFEDHRHPLRLNIYNFKILPNQCIVFKVDYRQQCMSDILGKSWIFYLNIILRSYDNFPERVYFGTPNDLILKQGDKYKNPYAVFADPECLFCYMRTGIGWNIERSILKELEQLDVNIFSGIELSPIDTGYKYKVLFKKQKLIIPEDIFEISNEKEIEENRQANQNCTLSFNESDIMWDAGYNKDGSERVHTNDTTLDDAFEGDSDYIWNID